MREAVIVSTVRTPTGKKKPIAAPSTTPTAPASPATPSSKANAVAPATMSAAGLFEVV